MVSIPCLQPFRAPTSPGVNPSPLFCPQGPAQAAISPSLAPSPPSFLLAHSAPDTWASSLLIQHTGPLHKLCPLQHLERLSHLQVVHSFASSALGSDVTSSPGPSFSSLLFFLPTISYSPPSHGALVSYITKHRTLKSEVSDNIPSRAARSVPSEDV